MSIVDPCPTCHVAERPADHDDDYCAALWDTAWLREADGSPPHVPTTDVLLRGGDRLTC